VPGDDLGRESAAEAEAPAAAEPGQPESEPGAADEPVAASAGPPPAAAAKKKTRRGTRGGRNRKKKPATAAQNGGEASTDAPPEEPRSENGDFDYVPMSEWADELETGS
jgi:hypothetical protein